MAQGERTQRDTAAQRTHATCLVVQLVLGTAVVGGPAGKFTYGNLCADCPPVRGPPLCLQRISISVVDVFVVRRRSSSCVKCRGWLCVLPLLAQSNATAVCNSSSVTLTARNIDEIGHHVVLFPKGEQSSQCS